MVEYLGSALALFPSAASARAENLFKPMSRPCEMLAVFEHAGLCDVTETALMIRMEYENFEDLWSPYVAGEGQQGKYVMTLDERQRGVFEKAARCLRSRRARRSTHVRRRCLGVSGGGELRCCDPGLLADPCRPMQVRPSRFQPNPPLPLTMTRKDINLLYRFFGRRAARLRSNWLR